MPDLLDNPIRVIDTQDESELFGDDIFPNSLWYLKDEAANKYGAFHVDCKAVYDEPIDCLAVFRTAEEADQFAALIDTCFMIPYGGTFDEIREIAKTSGKGFRGLALMDRWDTPLVHFIA